MEAVQTYPQDATPATPEMVWALLRELTESQKETARQMQETDRQMKETGRKMARLNKQMGGLHNSFGEMAEHLVAPSIV